jgi:NAD(P)-dependent dehydrogenase (short-subunit alcohol dehydrogenase family)
MNETRTVLVTGASTGIGRLTALRLAHAGWRVFASVRNGTDVEALVSGTGTAITPLLFDVTDAAGIADAARRIDEAVGEAGLSAVVNNAGIAVAGPLEFMPLEQLQYQFEVNVIGQVAVTQALMPALRRARGRILFVGSVAGRSPMPFIGPYAASKAAIDAIATALRVEVRPWGIAVSVIEPAAFASSIWGTSLERAEGFLSEGPPQLEAYYGVTLEAVRRLVRRAGTARPPHPVAATIEKALLARNPRARYLVGRGARSRVLLEMLPVRIRDAIIAASLRRF